MSARSIKIRVVKESAKTVTIRMLSLNREMPVPKAEFEKRIESGMYEIVPLRKPPPPPEPEAEETPATEATEATEGTTDVKATEGEETPEAKTAEVTETIPAEDKPEAEGKDAAGSEEE